MYQHALACTEPVLAGQVRPLQGLRERKLGLLEGTRRAEAGQQHPEAWQCLLSPVTSTKIPGGGESIDELRSRVVAALEDIAARHQG
jgi:2,3-bisphosphoglycerate-dependent phosphoglycerate mutase